MAVDTAAGSKIYIGPANSTADEQAEFEALSFTEIEEVESIGIFGDSVSEVTFTALNDRRVRKFKGSYNAGNLEITMGRSAAATGQAALVAALAVDGEYAFKVELDDAGTGSPSNNTTFYFRGRVMGYQTTPGNAESIVMATSTIAINSAFVEVAAV